MTSDDIVKRLELRSIEANDTIKILYQQLNDICALNNKNIYDLSNTLLEELKDIEFAGSHHRPEEEIKLFNTET